MVKHHPTLAPSSLPMLEQCPCFERADDSWSLEPTTKEDYRDRGTILHKVYESMMRADGKPIPEDITHFELEGLNWAVDFTKTNLTVSFPIEIEQRLILMDDEFNIVTYGTGDVINGLSLFDLKTGDYHNYWLQIASYALMQMDRIGVDRVTVTLLFLRFKKAIELVIDRDEAHRRVFAVVKSVLSPHKKPRPNPYCKWCRKILTCEAVLNLAEESGGEFVPETADVSRLLKSARILKSWIEQIESYAKEQALAGTEIADFELKVRQGAREIMDVKRAYELAGIPPDDFLRICNVPIGAIEDFIATKERITKSKAKKIVNDKLGVIIRRRDPSARLVLVHSNEEPTEP